MNGMGCGILSSFSPQGWSRGSTDRTRSRRAGAQGAVQGERPAIRIGAGGASGRMGVQ